MLAAVVGGRRAAQRLLPHGPGLGALARSSTRSTRDEAPSAGQLWNFFFHSAVTFVGFGVMDNTVMLLAGDAIDNTLGVRFGLATLTAAAFGQIFSDVSGICFGSTVEALATRIGLPIPELTAAQRSMRVTKLVGTMGSICGVVAGCLIGMSTLLFIDVNEANRAKREKELSTIFEVVFSHAREVFDAEASSLFVLDREKGQLWSRVTTDVPFVITCDIGKGVVGQVAENGEVVNIKDAMTDPRVNHTVDRSTGFCTRSILCAPVRNAAGEVVAVVEVINKRSGEGFDASDEKSVRLLATHVGLFMQEAAA